MVMSSSCTEHCASVSDNAHVFVLGQLCDESLDGLHTLSLVPGLCLDTKVFLLQTLALIPDALKAFVEFRHDSQLQATSVSHGDAGGKHVWSCSTA